MYSFQRAAAYGALSRLPSRPLHRTLVPTSRKCICWKVKKIVVKSGTDDRALKSRVFTLPVKELEAIFERQSRIIGTTVFVTSYIVRVTVTAISVLSV